MRRNLNKGGGETYCEVTVQDLEICLPGLKEQLTYLGSTRDLRVFEVTT
jgi:hypothetical protein